MKDFNKALADQDHQRRMRLERKRREFWENVEFYFAEVLSGLMVLGAIAGVVYWVITR